MRVNRKQPLKETATPVHINVHITYTNPVNNVVLKSRIKSNTHPHNGFQSFVVKPRWQDYTTIALQLISQMAEIHISHNQSRNSYHLEITEGTNLMPIEITRGLNNRYG